MPMRLPPPALALLSALAVGLVPASSRACASCGCGDPTLLSLGVEQPFGGRFRVFSEGQYRTESQGTAQDGGSSVEEWSLTFGGSYSFSRAIALSVTVPVLFRTMNQFDLSTTHATNLGDIEAVAKFVLWRDREFSSRHLLSLLGGMRFPTAPLQYGSDGEPLNTDIQAGPGSWWGIFGASYYGRLVGSLSLYASVLGYVPTEGRQGLKPGASGRGTLWLQLQPWNWLSLRAGTDARLDGVWHENGEVSPDTGGFIAFFSPAVLLSPATDWVIQLAAKVPVVNHLTGVHSEGTYASLSLVVDL
jgi:hypothetical protein